MASSSLLLLMNVSFDDAVMEFSSPSDRLTGRILSMANWNFDDENSS